MVKSQKKKWIATLIMASVGMALVSLFSAAEKDGIAFSASSRHFSNPKPTPLFIDFIGSCLINTKESQPGDEVAVFTSTGILCGAVAVTTAGQYGVLHVYGDDPSTEEIEGALPGEELMFVVWDSHLKTEYTLSPDEMAPVSLGSFSSSPIPVVWKADKSRYGLNLTINRLSEK